MVAAFGAFETAGDFVGAEEGAVLDFGADEGRCSFGTDGEAEGDAAVFFGVEGGVGEVGVEVGRHYVGFDGVEDDGEGGTGEVGVVEVDVGGEEFTGGEGAEGEPAEEIEPGGFRFFGGIPAFEGEIPMLLDGEVGGAGGEGAEGLDDGFFVAGGAEEEAAGGGVGGGGGEFVEPVGELAEEAGGKPHTLRMLTRAHQEKDPHSNRTRWGAGASASTGGIL